MTTDLLTIAKQIADRAEAESVKQNVPVAVTVIDIHGKRRSHPPYERSAGVFARARRTKGLHVRAHPPAHRRPRALVQPGAELYPAPRRLDDGDVLLGRAALTPTRRSPRRRRW